MVYLRDTGCGFQLQSSAEDKYQPGYAKHVEALFIAKGIVI
jgi:hypothetical protein